MTSYLKYLVVMAPLLPNQIALDKACTLAEKANASLTAFACVHLSDREINHYPSRQEAKHSKLQELDKWMLSQVKPHTKWGIEITTKVAWNSDWPLAASHHADQIGANLIVQSGGDGGLHQRELLRFAPCPVLVARSTEPIVGGVVVAALDIYSDDDAHIALNHAVITAALNLAEDTSSTLHLVCALDEKEVIASHLGFQYLEDINAQQPVIADRFGVSPEQVHVQLGNPQVIITECVDIIGADVLVIGTVARRGITGKLLGNTAEKILVKTDCDLLVVN